MSHELTNAYQQEHIKEQLRKLTSSITSGIR